MPSKTVVINLVSAYPHGYVGKFLRCARKYLIGCVNWRKIYCFVIRYERTAPAIQWSEFVATDPWVPCSITGANGFSEYQWVCNGAHSAS
jgi:hypothetical protein